MKYTWKVDYVYDGSYKELIGKHDVKVKLDKIINVHCDDVYNFFLKKLKGTDYGAHCWLKNSPIDKTRFDMICIQDIKAYENTEKVVKMIMGFLSELREDPNLEEKRNMITNIKKRKGRCLK